MSKKVLTTITTIDNPFDPFEDFESWFNFDVEKGYYTSSRLARITKTHESMTEKEENEAIEAAVDRLIEIDPLDLYKKVQKVVEEDDEEEETEGEGS